MKSPRLVVYQPTELILGVLKFKNIPYTLGGTREFLVEVEGPAISFGSDSVVGQTEVLGWLDRRYPFPTLFPQPHDEYSRAATVAYALDSGQVDPVFIYENRDPEREFLISRNPTIADVTLAVKLKPLGTRFNEWATRVLNFSGPAPEVL